MDEIDFSILDMLDIKDIQVACKHADLEILLKPIKDHPDFYKKYVKQLGSNRPDKKSSIVKLYMPRIAFDLFQKGDVTYKGVIVQILENYKSKFEEAMTEYIKPPIDIEEIKAYNAEQLVELYFKIVDVSATDAPIDFYFMMLKLEGVKLDEECSCTIEHQVKQIEKQKKEIADAVFKAEKHIEQKYTQEVAQISKEKRELEKKYSEAKKMNRELAAELEKIKDQIEHQMEELTEKWRAEFDREIMLRQMEEDKEFNALRERKQHDLDLALADDESKKREALKDKLAKEEQQLQEQFKQKKRELDNIIEGLHVELQNNTDRKTQMESELKLLQEEKEQLQGFMNRLKAYEKEYFDNFEQHIIQKKVDTILLSKLGVEGDTITAKTTFSSIVMNADKLQEDTEECDASDNVVDLFDDLCDNISVYFDESSEITSILLSALLSNKAVIVTDDVAYQMVSCISALIDAKTPLMIQMVKQKDDVDKIVGIINESDSYVVYLPGLLDDYDEVSFSIICRQCPRKVIIAGVATLVHLSMMSGGINNYAITMDISNYLHFKKKQALWIGKYSLDSMTVEHDVTKCKEYYNKYFRGLVLNHMMGKKVALDFCFILSIYFDFMQGQIGDILKAVVSKVFDCKADENATTIVEKSEFYIG